MGIEHIIYSLMLYTLLGTMFLLFTKKTKHISVKILIFYAFSQVISVASTFLSVYPEVIYTKAPQLMFIPAPFSFALVPAFYLYIKTSVHPELKLTKIKLMHFIPFVLVFVIHMFLFWFRSKSHLHYILANKNSMLESGSLAISILTNLQYFIYSILLLITLRKERYRITHFHTVFNTYFFKSAIYLYLAGFMISVITNVFYYFNISFGFDILFLNSLYFYFFFMFIFFITIKGYNTKEIPRYKAESDFEELKKLYEKIILHIKENKSYLEPAISLKQFSESINENTRVVSQAINQFYGSNFNDLMNFNRIEYSKQILSDMPGLNIQEVMYKSGFTSKATFNKVFKDMTKMTPKEYKSKFQGKMHD